MFYEKYNGSLTRYLQAMDRLSTTWKSDLLDEIKQEFFQAVAMAATLGLKQNAWRKS